MKNFVLCLAIAVSCLAFSPEKADAKGWGGMYVSAGAAAQALSVTAAKFTGFVTALPSSSANGDTSVVSVIASDHITLAPGHYLIRFDYAGTADATTLVTFTLRNGATAITGASTRLNHPAATTVATSMSFIFNPTAAATLSVYAVSASGTPSITASDCQIVVCRLD